MRHARIELAMEPLDRVTMFDCPMDSASLATTVEYIKDAIEGEDFIQHGAINVAKLVNMQTDAALYAAVTACDIISVDGMGLVWGGRLLGLDIPERVTGVDLFRELVSLSEQYNYPIYLLGARNDVVERTVQVLEHDFPKLRIAGYHHGYFWDNESEVVAQIRRSGAKLLFVAISSPRKEIFINKWKSQFGVNFAMGVGGTFDVVAGEVHRAPPWVQKMGLEWLFRVCQEPRRMFKRYLVSNAKFAWMMTRALLK